MLPETPAPAGAPRSALWPQYVVAFWLLGVAVCLLRTLRETFAAERLRRRCAEVTEPWLLALLEELCARLRLSRRVRMLVSQDIAVPAVMGLFRPVILLPATLLTGLPPEAWRAIIAHELAHVYRWDYLANLGQMLIEALLFFNPFVWWISRQIRLEREACCDQLAAGECDSSARYVRALVSVLERRSFAEPSAPAPLLAALGAGGGAEGSVLDRTRRLLVPGYLPVLRLRWFSLALVLAFCGLTLAGFWIGTRALAETVRAPRPAVQRAATSPSSPFLIEVGVHTEDGGSIPEQGLMVYADETATLAPIWPWRR